MKNKAFRVHPDAADEAKHAALWYRQRSPITAKRFVVEINRAFDKILEAPARWRIGFAGTRNLKVLCFPFHVIYRESHGAVLVIAISHDRRRPGYWDYRL